VNEHPEELLADYVEQSLGAGERARVEAHIVTCDRCREEVELAIDARGALLSLPDLEAPGGIPLGVRRKARRAVPSRAQRVAGIAVAASVLAAGITYGLTRIDLGGGGEAASTPESEAPAAGGEAPAPQAGQEADTESATKAGDALRAPPALPTYLETRHDYGPDGLAPLARRLRDEALEALDLGIPPTAERFFESFDPAAFTVPVRQAIRCVLAEVPPEQLIVPFRIEAASFEGRPAYIAAFLQGPTPQDPYDRIVLWVVDREGCSLLSFASQVL
jgi:anti-sigma factor RsiW